MSGLRKRILRVAVKLPGVTASNPNADPFDPRSGNVILDESLNLKVRIKKMALAIQNSATIEVTNLLQSVRQQLLSNFNQFRSAQLDNFGTTQPLAEVWIKAGYESQDGTSTVAQIYHGEVKYTDLVGSPPNVTVDFTCYTHQVDRSTWLANTAPESMTFGDFVRWAGNQMGFDNDHIKCSTKYDAQIIENPARSIGTVYQLLPYIQDWQHPDVAAFIDDDFLIVKDRYAILNPNTVSQLNEFIGIPSWTEYGVSGVVFLDPSIRLASAVQFTSLLNPSLNGKYVAMGLDYNLSSREVPFYVKVDACPPADSDNAVVSGS
jgi:hypothetical protein